MKISRIYVPLLLMAIIFATFFHLSANSGDPLKEENNSPSLYTGGKSQCTKKFHLAYTTSHGSNKITPVDLKTGSTGPAILLDQEPKGLVISPNGLIAYIFLENSKKIIPIDLSTGKAFHPLILPYFPRSMAITPDSSLAYVIHENSNRITSIELKTGIARKAMSLEKIPSYISLAADGHTLYVGYYECTEVTSINLKTQKIESVAVLNEPPNTFTIHSKGQFASANKLRPHALTFFHIEEGSEDTYIDLDKPIQNISISPNGEIAYVTHKNSPEITVVDFKTQLADASITFNDPIKTLALYPKEELVASFEAEIGLVGEPSFFDASATIPFYGPIIEYNWDFGDGHAESTTVPVAIHTYQAPGFVDVNLIVTESMENSLFRNFTDENSDDARSFNAAISNSFEVIEKASLDNDKAFMAKAGNATTTALASSANPAIFGETVTFTATVTSAFSPTPTGLVIFNDGANLLGTGNLNGSGVATFTTSSLGVGTHSITANYGGDSNFSASSSAPLSEVIDQAATTTALTSSVNPSVFSQPVTLTATITVTSPGLGSPIGTVSFLDGATVIGTGTVNNDIATFTTSSLSVSTHTLSAVYSGDTNFITSTSINLAQTVNQGSTTIGLTSSVNPSVFGESVTFTATVTASSPAAGIPTGTVSFLDGATTVGTGTLSGGVATFSTSNLSVATHSLTAVYGGDVNFTTSTSPAVTQTVNLGGTTTSVSSSVNPSSFGQSITFTAIVSPASPAVGTPTGTVSFYDGATLIGTNPLSGNVATLVTGSLSVGSHSITATYNGDTNFTTSTSPSWVQTVNTATTTTAINSSSNLSIFGNPVTFTATISITAGTGTPTGTVTFFDGITTLAVEPVSSDTATFTTSSLAVGSHSITAVYSGDSDFATSNSPILTQIVNQGSTSTVLTSNANPSFFGESVTFSAAVTVTAGAGTPTGTVTFSDGATVLGTGAVNSGIATFSISTLIVGTHSITASYGGDTNFTTSTSTALPQAVNQATPLVNLSSSINPSPFSGIITFTASVSSPTTLGLPTGTVTFFDGATAIGTGTLTATGANTSTTTFTTSTLTAGTHPITATYNGDANFLTQTSAVLDQVVSQAVTTSTTIFSNSVNPSEFGQPVLLQATVKGSTMAPAFPPTGTVSFYDNTTLLGTVAVSSILPNTSQAMLTVSNLTTGTHSITAVYSGDVNYPGSTSPTPLIQRVIKSGTSSQLSTSVTPSVFGQTVTFTNVVTATAPGGGAATGTVEFYNGATLLGTATLTASGANTSTATFSTSSLILGSHIISALYNGDSNFTSSTSNPLKQVVGQDTTTPILTSSLNPSSFGQSITLTAAVDANAPGSGTPTGTVQFFNGSTLLGTATLTGGSASLSSIVLYPGTHTLKAVYSGDPNFIASTSAPYSQVVLNTLATVTTITSGRNSSPTGQAVVFSATVTAITGTPTGTVTFSDGGVPFGTGTIVNGIASFTEPGSGLTTLGLHDITATYNGDANFDPSNSPTYDQYVVPYDTSIVLTSTPNHSEQGNATFTATVTKGPGSPSTPLPGTVTFYDGNTPLTGTVTFNSTTGVATISPDNLEFSPPPSMITAVYSGDQTTFAMSTSNTISQQVQQTDMLTTSTIVSTSLTPAFACQPINLTAVVTATQGFYTPTGSVTFFDQNVEIGTALLDNTGTATLSISTLVVGSHSISATYNSDSNYAFSVSNTITQNIVANNTTTAITVIPNQTSSPFGQNIIFSAVVSSQYSIATGSITFSDASGDLATVPLDNTGTADLELSTLPVGTYTITATYNPDSCFAASSTSMMITIDPVNPAATLTTSPNPSIYGETVTVAANLSSPSGTPTGTVTFYQGVIALGTVPLVNGLASITVPNLPAGFTIMSATYSGDTNFLPNSLPSVVQTVNQAATTTYLASVPSIPNEYGQPVIFTATVSSNAQTPTGTITFKNGAAILGVVALNGIDTASLQVSSLPLGSNSITAIYSGDTNFITSTSSALNQTVIQTATTTTVTTTSNPSSFGASVTFNIAVDPVYPGSGIPTGTVTGYFGSALIGSATLANGVASFTNATLPSGVDTITFIYSGDTNFISSVATTTQTVNPVTSTTTLASNHNPSVFGQPITLTATVTSTAGTPTGTVSFLNGTTQLGTVTLNSSGAALLSLSNLPVGTYSITAIYSGSLNINGSTSTALSQVVNKAVTSTAVVSSFNPSFFGESVTLTATVTPTSPGAGTPTGTVTFKNGATTIGTGTLSSSGQAILSLASLPTATNAITAVYSGDTNFYTSTSGTLNQVVNKSATIIAASATPNPVAINGSVTVTATVTPVNTGSGIPTGTVNAFYGATLLGTGTLNGSGVATLTFSSLPSGTLGIVIQYLGDTNFLSSSTPLTETVNQATSTTALTSSVNPSLFGQPTTFTATVTSVEGTPTGTVSFLDGTTTLGTESLNSGGIATLTLSTLSVGTHSITAVYSGAANIGGSTSTVVSQVVNQSSTTTALASTLNPSFFGQNVTLNATVVATSPGAGIPTGTVTFKNGATTIGTAAVNSNGLASLTLSSLAVGTSSITAVYGGNVNFTTSTSSTLSQVVNKSATLLTASTSPNPSNLGATVTLTATVSPVNTGSGTPTGTVQVFNGSTLIGSGTLNGSGVASFTLSSLPSGNTAIVVNYLGDADFNAFSTTVIQTVNQATSTTALASSVNPSAFGQAVTFTASVTSTGGTATGSVAFLDGTVTLGTQTLNASGIATLTLSNLPLGTSTITAVYSGSGNISGSTSTALNQVVNQSATTTSISSSSNPSAVGQNITFTAAVFPLSPGAGIPSGTVTFQNGAATIGTGTLNGSGLASFSISNLPVGTNSITAIYAGNVDFATSTSTALSQIVGTSTALLTASTAPNPANLGETVTLTATVTAVSPTAGIPTGTVEAFNGSSLIGSGTLNGSGTASFALSDLPAGITTIVVNYSGDANFNASSTTVTQTINQVTSTTTLSSSVNPSVFGEAVTFTASVASLGGTASGTVAFLDGTETLATQTLNGAGIATLTLSDLSIGTHFITAIYSGNTNISGSTSTAISQVVNQSATTTIVASSFNPAFFGESITLSAKVSATSPGSGVPTGSVTFLNGTATLGAATLDANGQAKLSVATLPTATNAITAVYSGDTNFITSTSAILSQVINKSATMIAATITPNPITFGANATLTATVSPINTGSGIPTGTVQAFYGSTLAGSGTLNSSGVATFTLSDLPGGTFGLVVEYLGDTNFLPSVTPLSQTVNQSLSSTALQSSANPSVYQQPVTFTATITSTSGTVSPGTVIFLDGTTEIGTQTVNGSGLASITVSSLSVGTHPITAIFSGNANVAGSISTILNQVIDPASTHIAMISSLDPSTYLEPITLTAIVTPTSPGAGTPTGSVTFTDGATILGTTILSQGQATFTTSSLTAGIHALNASYDGDGNFASSNTVTSLSQTVNQAATQTAIVSSTPNPSTLGQQVSFFAAVTSAAGVPTGTVTFTDGATAIGTVPVLDGIAIFDTNLLSVGNHSVTATFNGNANFLASTSTPPTIQTVNQTNITITTVTTLTSNLNPSNFSDPVTFNVVVTPIAGPGTPTGVVSIYLGAEPLATEALVNGQASYTTSTLPAGNLQIVAIYSGDSQFSSSTEVLSQVVNPISTTTNLSSSLNPSVFGDSVTFTALVSANGTIPTGTVTFFNGTTILQTVSLNDTGTASYTTSAFSAGTYPLTATYNPDPNFTTSSGFLSQVVNLAPTSTIILTSEPAPANQGDTITFIASATSTAGIPEGSLAFFDGTTLLGSAALYNGLAVFKTSSLAVGTHSITAAYSGNANLVPSTSSAYTQVVGLAIIPTTIALSSSIDPSTFDQAVTFNAVVSASTGVPSGTVTFFDGSTVIGIALLTNNGLASFTTTALTTGTHLITAIYTGNTTFGTSTSEVISQVVNSSNTTISVSTSPNPSTFGSLVTLTATVSSASTIPSGLVTFLDGSTVLGTSTLNSNGVAIFQTSSLALGSHPIKATYAGNSGFNSSTSIIDIQLVKPSISGVDTTLSSSSNPSVVGDIVTFSSTVTSSSGIPTGTVTFFDGSTAIANVLLTKGQATFSTSNLSVGTHSITAIYNGSSTFSSSSSPAISQVVEGKGPNLPRNFHGKEYKRKCSDKKHRAILLKWDAPLAGTSISYYNIYRDSKLKHQIGKVFSTGCLRFLDKKVKKKRTYSYYIVAVNSFGASQPVKTVVGAKKSCSKSRHSVAESHNLFELQDSFKELLKTN